MAEGERDAALVTARGEQVVDEATRRAAGRDQDMIEVEEALERQPAADPWMIAPHQANEAQRCERGVVR